MNMNITSTKFLAAILFSAIAIAPLYAQTNAPAENVTNSPVAVTDSAPASNMVSVTGTKAQNPSSESSPVRIDDTGVHVGGENPVDIDFHKFIPKSSLPAVLLMLVPFAPFAMIIAIIAIVFYFKHRRNKMMHETMLAMIEKGVPITPEMLAQLQSRPSRFSNQPGRSRQRHLLGGLIFTGVGSALLITNLGRNSGDGKLGLIFLFMGVAFLIVWFVERNDKNNEQPPKP
jgi:hypothetical protein